MQHIVLQSTDTQQDPYTSSTNPCNPRHWVKRNTPWEIVPSTETTQFSDSSEQKECAVYVPIGEIPLDLQLVFNAWGNLPKTTRSKIISLVLEVMD
ncbi:MAG: hypothetical protein JW779_14100 [Candidatus Thorarchaeota archaeon]|nr:hypothetical protein [Candidatus Thorarchaeota archaeon]